MVANEPVLCVHLQVSFRIRFVIGFGFEHTFYYVIQAFFAELTGESTAHG